VNKAIAKLIRSDLIILDDVGLLPISAEAAEAMFRVIDAAYERRSVNDRDRNSRAATAPRARGDH
jgi:DNA replication protein DnaC